MIVRIFAHRANCDAKGKRLASKACYGAPMNRIVDTNAASVRHLADLHAAHDADVGVILVQVDQLARINHSAGTEAGDALLEEVARRLENFAGDEFGHGALVERLGGPRFLIVPARPLSLATLQAQERALHVALAEPMVGDPSGRLAIRIATDRKSPRLNSSH